MFGKLFTTFFCVWTVSNSRTKQCSEHCFVKMSLDVDGALGADAALGKEVSRLGDERNLFKQ